MASGRGTATQSSSTSVFIPLSFDSFVDFSTPFFSLFFPSPAPQRDRPYVPASSPTVGPGLATADAYCSNRVCAGHSCSESMNVGSIEACAAAVEANPNCGIHFSYGDGQYCDCVPPGSDCGTLSFDGYNTYTISGKTKFV